MAGSFWPAGASLFIEGGFAVDTQTEAVVIPAASSAGGDSRSRKHTCRPVVEKVVVLGHVCDDAEPVGHFHGHHVFGVQQGRDPQLRLGHFKSLWGEWNYILSECQSTTTFMLYVFFNWQSDRFHKFCSHVFVFCADWPWLLLEGYTHSPGILHGAVHSCLNSEFISLNSM